MVPTVRTLVDALRRPEYTGENRCLPCTAVNFVVAVGLAVLVGGLFAPDIGLGVLVVATGAIYVRGYLVPGTPTLTKRYAPDFVLGAFGKGPTLTSSNGDKPVRDLEALLRDEGLVRECPSGTDLCLDPAFRDAWHARMGEIGSPESNRRLVASMLGVDPSGVAFRETADAFVVRADQHRVGEWPAAVAFAADLASTDLLPEWMDSWERLSAQRRASVASGLRLFLDTCPACDADLEMTADVVESCCREIPVFALECSACGIRLSEIERSEEVEH